jgi:riboflavin synthase
LEKHFVPFPEDLPEMARECAEESDFVFVFGFADDEEQAKMLREKLIDVEIATETKILKSVITDEFSDLDEEEYLEQKNELVKKYSELIVGILFNEERFEPEDRDFSI